MPEDEKKDTPSQADADKALIDRITAGVTAGVAAAIPKITESIKPAASTAPRVEPSAQQLVRPSEEDIVAAIADGNKGEAARLMKLQRAADQQEQTRALGTLSSQGSAAIGSLAKQAAERLPQYKRFKTEIDKMVEEYCAGSGAVPDYSMYERAHSIVRGNHLDEILAENTEETLRKSREPVEPLIPDGRRAISQEAAEPTSLQDVLIGDWNREFRPKKNAVHGRSDDEELRHMGFNGGLKEFVATRKNLEALEDETNGTFGLDRDWVWDNKSKNEGHWL